MPEETSEDLLSRARAGDAAAFAAVLEPLLDPAYRLAVTLLRSPTEAEDAVQDACFTAWRRLQNVRPGSQLKPWFLAVVANCCRSTRRARWWSVLQLNGPRAGVAPVRDLEVRLDLQTSFDRLRDDQKRVLALFYGLDLSLPEVAAALGCSQSAARGRLYRAVAAMRPHLATERAET